MALAQGRLGPPKRPGVWEGQPQADFGLSLERSNLFIPAQWLSRLLAMLFSEHFQHVLYLL